MKVALVYPMPFGGDGAFGGGERYTLELATWMARSVETVLVTVGRTRKTEYAGPLCIQTYPWIALIRGLRQNPLTVGFIQSLLGVDVIHCVSYSTLLTDMSLLFGRLAGKKVFITDVGGGGNITLARWLNVARLSQGLLLLSEFASGTFPGTRPRRQPIYGGVDVERFTPGPKPRQKKVLFVGRLLPQKGINYLIDAVMPATRLVIAGRVYHRDYFAELKRLAIGKNVTFLTDATDDDVIAEYRSSAVLVLPSVYRDIYGTHQGRPELLGLALLEGMACATPVICTNVGGMPEIVQDGVSGFVVPPNDAAALSEKIGVLLEDQTRIDEMGARGRAAVLERFTWSRVVDRCLEAYQAVA